MKKALEIFKQAMEDLKIKKVLEIFEQTLEDLKQALEDVALVDFS